MEDLDQLQHDLEMLLSTCSVRIRLLRSEIEEERKDERGKQSLKRKKCDDHLKVRESKNRVRILKAKHYGLQVKTEAPKIIMPRSDTADKFWLGVDAYCADVTKDDIAVSVTFSSELMVQTIFSVSGRIDTRMFTRSRCKTAGTW